MREAGHRNGRLILLIEDNPEDERLILKALKENVPAAVHVARDGSEALAFLHGEGHLPVKPDLILLDIKLPKYSGLEVLKRIRSHKDTAQIPVVMLTSSDDWNDIDLSYQLGANSYIRKAIDIERYLQEVRMAGIYWTVINIAEHTVQS